MALSRIVGAKRLTSEPNVITGSLINTAIQDERKWFEEEKRDLEPDRTDKIKWDAVDVSAASAPTPHSEEIAVEARIEWTTKETKLVLSYSRIRAIDNLTTLNCLLLLRLDNNEIERIEGLDGVPNLRELDLSFNKITAISGMSSLTHLTDLSLYSNKISHIENLDAQMSSLESLSIGRNELSDQRSAMYLRSFRSLRILCMEGNFRGTDSADYRASTVALLPQLRYLDWTLITDSERKSAQESHHRLVTDVHESGAGGGGAISDPVHSALGGSGPDLGAGSIASGIEANIAANASAVKEAGLQYVAFIWRIMMDPHSVADIAGLGAGAGHTALLASARHGEGKEEGKEGGSESARGGGAISDGDADSVMRIPGVGERVDMYRDAVAALVDQGVSRGLALHSDISREVTAADYVVNSYLAASDAQSKHLIDEYGRKRKNLLRMAEQQEEGRPAGEELLSPAHASGHHDVGPLSPTAPNRRKGVTLAEEASTSENSEMAAAEATLAALDTLHEENEALNMRLTGIETVLHEQVVAVLTEFDAAYAELGGKRNELFQKFYRSVEKEALITAEDCKTLTMNAVDTFQENAAMVSAMVTSTSTTGLRSTGAIVTASSGREGGGVGGGGTQESSRSKDGPTHGHSSHAHGHGHTAGEEDEEGSGFGTQGNPTLVLDDDVAALLADREGSLVAVSNAFDQRIARILAAEDKTRMSERDRERGNVKSRIVAEAERHRQRMGEVAALYRGNDKDIQDMILVEEHTLAELHDA